MKIILTDLIMLSGFWYSFSDESTLDFFGAGSDQNRFNQSTQSLHAQRTQQQQPMQNSLHHG